MAVMSNSTTTTKGDTGIGKALIDAAKSDISAIRGQEKGRKAVKRDIAKLSDAQKRALGLLEGGEGTKAFRDQLQGVLSGVTTGQDVLRKVATGEDKLTPEQITAMTGQFSGAKGVQDQLSAIDEVSAQNIKNLEGAVGRQLKEGALPSIYRQAAGTGNVGSSRAAISEGIARRGAEESISKGSQNILSSAALQKAGLRSKAYDQALAAAMGLSSQQRAERTGAAKDVAGMGMEAGKTGMSAEQQALQNLMAGGALEQAQRQSESDEAYRQRVSDQRQQSQALDDYLRRLNALRGVTDTTTQQTTVAPGPSTSDIIKGAGIPIALGLGAKWIGKQFDF